MDFCVVTIYVTYDSLTIPKVSENPILVTIIDSTTSCIRKTSETGRNETNRKIMAENLV